MLRNGNWSPSKLDLDIDRIWNTNPHYLPHGSFIGINVNESLVYSHFPFVPRFRTLATGSLPSRHNHSSCWEGNRPSHSDASLPCYSLNLIADAIEVLCICTGQPNSCFLSHGSIKLPVRCLSASALELDKKLVLRCNNECK